MIILAGTIRVPTDSLQNALPVFEKMITASRAEPGCIAYAFSYDALEPGLVRIFETYTDARAVESHRNSKHFAEWRAAWPGLGIGDRDMSEYAVSGSKKLP
jgi:quinol monooxygenase YgiN